MGITYSITREPVGTAPIPTPLSDSTGSTSLAELLVEVGLTIEALPADRIETASAQLAAITAHLVDGAHEAGADGGLFTPSRQTISTLSLRTLGRLAARTISQDVPLQPVRVARIRTLLATLAA
jgi:hypothetical protein